MSSFSYKTRGNSSPQGKSKVYFACHPEDFHLFETISDEILTEVNCAVFYQNAPIENEEAHLRDLAEMNLIVIPITTKFLTAPSAARDIEFPFSQQNHIPVLPLMQKPGLVDVFNKVLGDIQFLDPNATDSTAISYEEKFKNFLTSILVGDELAEEIRNAFDAYIFLSYRKKDRAYAQELMRLIHENDFCRDVAIWYDEFLIPGENFNNTIADALNKSKLFALAVTPNLLENPNYVMTTEYPMAKTAGKPILPIMLEKTGMFSLKRRFPKLPRPIKAQDKEALRKALTKALDGIASRENDKDPRHNYLMGIAYLSGIDVEKNLAHALSMLQFAARRGVTEALEKLVFMYKNGEGVKRDRVLALSYQEKLVEVFRNALPEQNEEGFFRYLTALWHLGDDAYVLEKYSRAKRTFETMLDATERANAVIPSDRLNRLRSVAYHKLGDLACDRGDRESALRYYQSALAVFEIEAKQSGNVRAWHDSEITLNRLGDMARDEGDPDTAYAYYLKAVMIGKMLAEVTKSADARHSLAICYHNLGLVAEMRSDPAAALNHYQNSLALLKDLVDETNASEYQRGIAIVYQNLGNLAKASGELASALTHYEASLAIREALVTECGTAEARQDLVLAYQHMGQFAKETGKPDKASEYFKKALALAQEEVRQTGSFKAKETLAGIHRAFGDLALKTGDQALARSHYLQALKNKEASASNGSADSIRELALIHTGLGDLAKNEGDLEEAEACYLKALALRQALLKRQDTASARRSLIVILANLSEIARKKGDYAKERELYLQALPIAEALTKEQDNTKARRTLSIIYEKLAEVEQATEQIDSAKAYYLKSLALCEALFEENATDQARHDLFLMFIKLGDLIAAKEGYAAARSDYEKALAVLRTNVETPENLHDLSILYNRMAKTEEAMGDLSEAIGYCQLEAVKTEALAQQTDSPKNRHDLALVYLHLAYLHKTADHPESVRFYASEALAIWQALAQSYPHLTRLDGYIARAKALIDTLP